MAAIALSSIDLTPSAARAAGPTDTEPVRIEYTAPRSCPNRAALEAQVFSRTARARLATGSEPARLAIVRVDEGEREFRGRLVLQATAPTTAHQERVVTSARCDDLIEALGFFVALAIDPSARAAPVTKLPQVPASALARAPDNDPTLPPVVPPPPPERSPPVVSPPSATPRDRPPRWTIGGGVGVSLVGGAAPSMLLANRAFIEVGRERPQSVFSPSLVVGGLVTDTAVGETSRGAIAIRLRSLVSLLCPLSISLSSSYELAFRPCALIEIGGLHAEGVAIERARQNQALWTAGGVSARLALPLVKPLLVELELGLAASFSQPRFTYRDTTGNITAFDPPSFGARMGLSLALRP